MDAHDHALVHRVIGFDKHATSFIEFTQSIGEDLAIVHGNQHPVFASTDLALVGLIAIKDVGDQSGTTRQIQKLIGKTNQAPGWYAVLQAHASTAIGHHVDQLALSLPQGLHDTSLVLLFNVGGDHLDRFVSVAIDLFEHHARLGDAHFITLTAHVFKQNRQVQFTTTHDLKHTLFIGLVDLQGHVVLQLLLQSIPELSAGDELAFASSQGAGVDAKVHGQSGLIDFQHGQGRRILRVRDGHTNPNVCDAVDQHDVTRPSLGHLHTVQALKLQDLVDASFKALAIRAFHHHHIRLWLDGA